MFKVGQKVVCIDADFSMHPHINNHYQNLPVENKVYTVEKIRPQGAGSGIILSEIRNKLIFFPLYQGKLEPAFNPKRFVPLEEFQGELSEVNDEELEIAN